MHFVQRNWPGLFGSGSLMPKFFLHGTTGPALAVVSIVTREAAAPTVHESPLSRRESLHDPLGSCFACGASFTSRSGRANRADKRVQRQLGLATGAEASLFLLQHGCHALLNLGVVLEVDLRRYALLTLGGGRLGFRLSWFSSRGSSRRSCSAFLLDALRFRGRWRLLRRLTRRLNPPRRWQRRPRPRPW